MRSLLRLLLLLSALLLRLHAQPSLSFFTELPGEGFRMMLSDSSVIRDLQAMRASLRVGLLDLDAAEAEGVRMLNAAGIPAYAWLLLPEAEGYWFHAGNGGAALSRYEAFKAWSAAEGLRWAGVGIDLEPSMPEMRLLLDHPARGIVRAFGRLFDDSLTRRGAPVYAELIRRIGADGWTAESYVIPLVLDGRATGSEGFLRLMGILDVRTPREIPMCYTSAIGNPGIIARYGAMTGAVALGSTGGGVIIDGAPLRAMVWEELERDLRIAAGAAREIHIFSLEGAVKQNWLGRLRGFDFSRTLPLDTQMQEQDQRQQAFTLRLLWWLDHPLLLSAVLIGTPLLVLALLIRLAWWLLRRFRRMKSRPDALS
ncbi:MAG: hypothetical protein NW241_02290 [Bacteroidia bacterium]|nr:hypothetical protein [Bacteroidia bacterium]